MNKFLLFSFLFCLFGIDRGLASINSKRAESISVVTFGAKGDGINDDSDAIKKTILYCIKNNKTCFIPKTEHFYNIGVTIRVLLENGQSMKIVSNGAIIKPLVSPAGNSAFKLTSFNEHVFLSIGAQIESLSETMFIRSSKSSIDISGLVFDGVNMKEYFAPGHLDADIFIGLQALAENVNINNCVFRNIYGYGVRVHNVKYSTITNCIFDNVGGRGATLFAQNIDGDAFGDGIYHALIKKDGIIKIQHCTFKGKKNRNKRSRSGITFEYSTQPYQINLDQIDISGFAKCIHIEEKARTIVLIDRIRMSDFNMGIVNALNDDSKIYFKNANIEVGMSDGNEKGEALMFANYRSKAMIYVDKSILSFKGKRGAYQSAVGLAKVENSTIDGNQTNFFFADGSTTFNNCIFVGFGGGGPSFFSSNGKSSYQVLNSSFKESGAIHGYGVKLKLQ